jgi:hypothetical protein
MVGIYWKPLVMLRWLCTMLIMTLFKDNYYMQIFLLLGISVAYQIIIVSYQPLEEKLDNIMLLLNEVTVSLYLYILLSLTDNSLLQLRDLLGWTLTLLVTVTVTVNLLKFLICFNYRRAYFSLKRFLHRLLPPSLLFS